MPTLEHTYMVVDDLPHAVDHLASKLSEGTSAVEREIQEAGQQLAQRLCQAVQRIFPDTRVITAQEMTEGIHSGIERLKGRASRGKNHKSRQTPPSGNES